MSLPITTASTMAMNNEAHSDGTTPMNNKNKMKKKEEEDNWMRDNRGSLMVVATVIASLTFQIAINPPGGVWQSDTDTKDGCAHNGTCKAGTSVLAFGSTDQKMRYEAFILLCTISFSASLATILILIIEYPLRRFMTWIFKLIMCVSVLCLVAAYMIAIWMVTNPFEDDALILIISNYYGVFWVALVALMCLRLSLTSLYYSIKKPNSKPDFEVKKSSILIEFEDTFTIYKVYSSYSPTSSLI